MDYFKLFYYYKKMKKKRYEVAEKFTKIRNACCPPDEKKDISTFS